MYMRNKRRETARLQFWRIRTRRNSITIVLVTNSDNWYSPLQPSTEINLVGCRLIQTTEVMVHWTTGCIVCNWGPFQWQLLWFHWRVVFSFTDVDDCVSSRCFNDATCLDGVNQYSCVCRDGFTGNFCEIGKSYIRTFKRELGRPSWQVN